MGEIVGELVLAKVEVIVAEFVVPGFASDISSAGRRIPMMCSEGGSLLSSIK